MALPTARPCVRLVVNTFLPHRNHSIWQVFCDGDGYGSLREEKKSDSVSAMLSTSDVYDSAHISLKFRNAFASSVIGESPGTASYTSGESVRQLLSCSGKLM